MVTIGFNFFKHFWEVILKGLRVVASSLWRDTTNQHGHGHANKHKKTISTVVGIKKTITKDKAKRYYKKS